MIKRTTVTAAFMAVGLCASLGYSAVAQQSQPSAQPSQQTQPSAQLSQRSQPSAQPSQRNQTQLSPLDRQFVMDAAHGGMAEVKLGQLALERSKDNGVQDHLQMAGAMTGNRIVQNNGSTPNMQMR